MAEPREQPRAAASIVASCTATDCTYNENRECHAGEINVRIDQQGALCATYEPEAPKARP
jgi:hypothetical protein